VQTTITVAHGAEMRNRLILRALPPIELPKHWVLHMRSTFIARDSGLLRR
jgi:hypothetical protein